MFTLGYFTCAQQDQRKCGSDKGGNKRKRNAIGLETKIIEQKKNEVLASTCAPNLSHLTIFANGQKQICRALKGSAPRTATITKRQRWIVCACVHTCMLTCACMYPQFCSNNRVVL
jgi:hypothetical protein